MEIWSKIRSAQVCAGRLSRQHEIQWLHYHIFGRSTRTRKLEAGSFHPDPGNFLEIIGRPSAFFGRTQLAARTLTSLLRMGLQSSRDPCINARYDMLFGFMCWHKRSIHGGTDVQDNVQVARGFWLTRRGMEHIFLGVMNRVRKLNIIRQTATSILDASTCY